MKLFQLFKEYAAVIKLQKKMSAFFPEFSVQQQWLQKFNRVDKNVTSAHNPSHVLQFILAIFGSQAQGCIVEAGAYKGASAAKISLVAKHVNRKLYVFDSFCGLPENNEQHDKSLMGHSIKDWFKGGEFSGSLAEVKENITRYGEIDVCTFVPGWFDDSMPAFKEPIALAYLDVDLASSTRTCLKYLYPLLAPGGVIYSQDGDFPLVVAVFKDEKFWREELGCTILPQIEGLGEKITVIRKA